MGEIRRRLPSRPPVPPPLVRLGRILGLPVSEVGRYWRQEASSIRAASGALAVGLVATLIAGTVLIAFRGRLEAVPGLLILIPAAIGMRGSIFGSLAARLSTGILTGEFTREIRRDNFLGRQVEAATLLSVSTAAEAGLLAWLVARMFGRETVALLDLVAISVVAGVAASVILLGVTIVIARQAEQRGWNMDDVGAPLITATGDLITLPILLVSSWFLLEVQALAPITGLVGLAAAAYAVSRGLRHPERSIRGIIRESLAVLTIAVTLQVLAGIVLEGQEEALVEQVPAVLGLVPAFAATCGSLGGMLASRLSSKLHIGLLEARLFPGRLAGLDVSLTFLLALLSFSGTGAIGWVGARLLGTDPPSVLVLVGVALVGGLLATAALSTVSYAAATATFRFGLDPDNHGIPIVTATMDLLGILCLVAAVALTGVG